MNYEKANRKRQGLINKLEALNTVFNDKNQFDFLDLSTYRRQVANKIQYLKNKDIRIVICGQFGSGKTSFLNTLLGIDFLPVKSGENSATIVYFSKPTQSNTDLSIEVHLGISNRTISIDKNDIKLFLEKQSSFYRINNDQENKPELLIKLEKYLDKSELKTIYSSGWNPARDVMNINVHIDNPLLNNGIVLVDTPGIASINETHEEITLNEINNASAIVYIFNYLQYGDASDFSFIRRMGEKEYLKTLFILNKIDNLYIDQVSKNTSKDIINTFNDKLKVILNKELDFNVLPLSINLYRNKDNKDIVNEFYKQARSDYDGKDLNELSNYENVDKNIREIALQLSSTGETSKLIEEEINEVEGLFNDFILKFQSFYNKIKEDINSDDEQKKLKEEKITKLINKLKNFNIESYFKQETIEKKIEDVKLLSEEEFSSKIKELINRFNENIEILTYDEYKNKKYKDGFNDLKSQYQNCWKNVRNIFVNNIKDYINDIRNKIETGDSEISTNFTQDFDSEYEIEPYLIESQRLENLKNEKSFLNKEIEELEKRSKELITEFKLKINEQNHIQGMLDNISSQINILNENINSMGAVPDPKIIITQVEFVAETRMFTGNTKKTGLREVQQTDKSSQEVWTSQRDKFANEINENRRKYEEYYAQKHESDNNKIKCECELSQLQEKIEQMRSALINLDESIENEDKELKKQELEKFKENIYAVTIGKLIRERESYLQNAGKDYQNIINILKDRLLKIITIRIEALEDEKNTIYMDEKPKYLKLTENIIKEVERIQAETYE